MATFHVKSCKKYDDYTTPLSAWEAIAHLIPRDKVIWEPFYCDGKSGENLRSLGFQVIHEDEDFFETDRGDIVVSNPPFSNVKAVLTRLVELKKPFILIMPVSKMNTSYFRALFEKERFQIMIPRKRIQFNKHEDGVTQTEPDGRCSFDCLYYAWQLNLPNDITWL